ncbi:hypothetical protein EJB05_47737, partial [Eragrostis curvula]
MDGPAGDLDRISALPDDLLHVILSFLGDARDVTRMAVLSRRWRHVWVHAKNLTFGDGDLANSTVPCHFAGFVDWALAKRGDVDMESLKIHFSGEGYASPEQVNEWLRYAARCVVRSVDFYLDVPTDKQQAVELPSHGRATSILLSLSRHSRVQLPAAAAASYQALTELRLVAPLLSEEVAGGTLGDFVTSCCPCLRRLSLMRPKGLPQLVLRSEVLEDLDITWANDLRMLDVAAPNLRIVSLKYCFHNITSSEEDDASKVARIVAPRIQEFCFQHYTQIPQLELDIHDLTSVRRLNNLVLDMHGRYCRETQVGLSFLAKCPGVQDVHVSLDHQESDIADEGDLVDLSTEGAEEEMQLLSLLFEGSNSIKCMAISETPRKIDIADLTQKIGKEVDSNNTILQKLMKVPCADGGQWHFVEQVFVWTCYATESRQMY